MLLTGKDTQRGTYIGHEGMDRKCMRGHREKAAGGMNKANPNSTLVLNLQPTGL